jgi:hypothetical protein
MKSSNTSRHSSRFAVVATFCMAALNVASAAALRADTNVPVSAFKALEVQNGAHVVLRHGEKLRVTVIQGSTTESAIRVDEGKKLLIDRCPDGCPRGYRLEVEVVAPEIDAVAVTDGGWLRCQGSFPEQADLAAAVSSGGTLDVRSMSVDDVSAAVQHGGRILTQPRGSLAAAISQGGAILYWGKPDVHQSIVQGGVVSRGRPADRGKPFEQIDAVEN